MYIFVKKVYSSHNTRTAYIYNFALNNTMYISTMEPYNDLEVQKIPVYYKGSQTSIGSNYKQIDWFSKLIGSIEFGGIDYIL